MNGSVYTNWFAPHLWPSIFVAVKKCGDLTIALHYLKTFHRKPWKVSGPYEKLNRRFLYEWFTLRSELKPHVKVVVKKGRTSILVEKHFSILETKPKLKDELITLLKNMCAIGQGLSAHVVQKIIKGIFGNRMLKLLKDFIKQGGLKVSLKWMKNLMNNHLNWSYLTTTTTTRKLPSTWEQEGTSMAHQITCLVKMYNIPPCLVVNTYQTKFHLVPTWGDWTWERKGAKHIQVIGIEDKRQITEVVSSLANGSMLFL